MSFFYWNRQVSFSLFQLLPLYVVFLIYLQESEHQVKAEAERLVRLLLSNLCYSFWLSVGSYVNVKYLARNVLHWTWG